MAWGLEARVPFLDKTFLEVAMNVNPEEKMFSKGSTQEVDADGSPKMEKVCSPFSAIPCRTGTDSRHSTSSGKRSTAHQTARYAFRLSMLGIYSFI